MDIRKFDVFPKLDNEYRIGTTSGGILSLLSVLMTIILAFSEIYSYLHPPIRQRLTVDMQRPTGPDNVTISQTLQPKLPASIDITFPSSPCYLLHFDVIDALTQLTVPLSGIKSTFTRLSPNGDKIGSIDIEKLVYTERNDKKCGSCYRANTTRRVCCRSCQEVFDAYKELGYEPPRLHQVEQCAPIIEKLKHMQNEGCSIHASFDALRVASEFHVAPGFSWNSEGWHVHDIGVFNKTFSDINLTHTIHSVKFTNTPGKYPLDNVTMVQTEHKAWRVVYTADILEGNFSASKYQMYDPKGYIPGVIIKYDVSPISATTYFDQEPFLHLCTRLITVIGGVLGIFRFMDTVLFHTRKTKKDDQIK